MADNWVTISEQEALGGRWETISEDEALGLTPIEPTEPRGRVAEFGAALGRGAMTVGKGVVGLHETLTKVPYVGAWGEAHREEELAEAGKWLENIGAAQESLARTRPGAGGWAINVIGETIPYMAAAMVGGYAAGPLGAAAVGFSTEGQLAYEEAIKGGATEAQAQTDRAIVGSINAAIESLQIGRIMKFHKTGRGSLQAFVRAAKNRAWKEMRKQGAGFGAEILKVAVEEAAEEAAQEGVSITVPGLARKDWPRKADGTVDMSAIFERIGGAALGGAVAGGVLGGGGAAVGGMVEAAPPSRARLESAAKKIQQSKLSDFEKARLLQAVEELGGPEAELSETSRRRLKTARKFETMLVDLETKRPGLRKTMKERAGAKLRTTKEIFEDPTIADPVVASRLGRKAAQGYAREQIPELTEKISRDEVTDLMQAMRESDLAPGQIDTLSRFFEDIMAGVQPHQSGIKAFDNFFGTNIIKRIPRKVETKGQKILRIATEPFNVLKAIVCSADFSAGGIQALMVAPNHPVIWGKGVGKGYRAFFNSKYTNLTELEMQTDPRFKLIEDYAPGLITKVGDRTRGEEYFVSEIAHKIPYIGAMVRASDRAFVTTLNNIRTNLFYQYMEQNPNASSVEIGEMLDHIGNMTGRGRGKPGGRFEKYAPELGAFTWAPRLYLATGKSVTDVVTKSHIRRIAAGDLVGATAFLLSILALASLVPGNEVEVDPRSSDFGKIKRGNTRVAFFGRHTQMIRLVAQLIMRQKKATATGRVYSQRWLKTTKDFLRSKYAPITGIATDIFTGRTYIGKKMRYEPEFMAEYALDHITPMFIQDVKDAIKYQGLGMALWTSPLAVHGIGVQTYEVHAGGESMNLKNHYAHRFFGADWDELGPEIQRALRESVPMIDVYEDRARRERENYARDNYIQEEQAEAGRKVRKKLSRDIQNELDRLELPFGGLSRRISSEWFLNEKRYEQYQKDLVPILNRIVPPLIKSREWAGLDPFMQRAMLEEVISECKKAVRQRIIDEATIKDLERMEF